jgi:hypothetical protein
LGPLWPPPLLAERPVAVQVLLVGVLPVTFGLVCGYILESSGTVYLVLQVLGILGGFFAGFEHDTHRGGVLRGVVGGTLFGLSILVGHESHGGGEDHDLLPSPAILLLVLTTGFGVLLGWLGAVLRRRRAG